MSPPKMHAHEIDTDVELVRRLLAGQFPQWAGLAIDPVDSYGTDHAIYRRHTNPGMVCQASHALAQVLADSS